MKKKLIIKQNGQSFTRIGTFIDNIIKYKETNKIDVELCINDNNLVLKKSGEINLECLHQEKKTIQVSYKAVVNGQEFSGYSHIKTTKLEINEDKITINYTVNGEVNNYEVNIIS